MKNYYRVCATSMLLIIASMEVEHTFVERVPWVGFSVLANNFSFILITSWILAIAGLWISNGFSQFAILLGILLAFVESLMLATGGNSEMGLAYFAVSILAAIFSGYSELHRHKNLDRKFD